VFNSQYLYGLMVHNYDLVISCPHLVFNGQYLVFDDLYSYLVCKFHCKCPYLVFNSLYVVFSN